MRIGAVSRRAIQTNPDVKPGSSVWNLLGHDFWGTPLTHSGSHKSYRPVTVLTFRLNYWLGAAWETSSRITEPSSTSTSTNSIHREPTAGSFHLVNVLLHACATWLYSSLCCRLLRRAAVGAGRAASVASLAFAVHPVHTEAVAGIVGRADVCACIFFLMSLLAYVEYARARRRAAVDPTACGGAGADDSAVPGAAHLRDGRQGARDAAAWWRSLACVPVPRTPVARESPTSKLAEVAAWANGGTTATNASTTMLALRSSTARLRSGEASSTHQQQQHQHQHHSSRHRHRRPRDKLHDVSLDDSEATTLALCLLSVPFLPATNLFFYVGFVVAERVLYIPSMGYCLLLGLAVDKAARVAARWAPAARRRAVAAGFTLACALLLVIFSARTLRRNEDWSTEEKLYRAGIPVNPPKAYGNVANILSAKGMKEEAEQAYKMALSYRSNMADVHYNMGILFQEQKRYAEALQAYNRAIQFRPRMAMAHLNMGLVLGILGRKEEAMEIYRKCALLDVTGLKDPRTHEATKTSALFNLGRLLADEGRVSDGIEAYLEAVQKMPSHYQPQSLYNMLGEAYFKLGDWAEAEKWYLAALRAKPDHVPAHLTYGKLLAKSNRVEEAEEMFKRAKGLAPEDCTVYQHFGQFLAESERHEEAAENYIRAASLASHDYEIVFNAANTLRQAGRNKEAENFYRKAVILRPEEATSHMNLGAMLHVNGKLVEAEASYLEALRLKPDDQITQANLNKLRQLLLKVSTRINS
ncbi:unnamed protein product [Notodromas monacha]|uniref:Uncharacterized protein n=1 Tax=Notodromas monacha TaxID=399045 RepID=A0A7R9BTZ1_9CRUS|nr:unnamed protein product [Notodromas monacha]CAG0920319.1 unnamed protein product [Notodromas monacha]